MDALHQLKQQYGSDVIVDIRGMGLMIGIELHPSIPTDFFIQTSRLKGLLLTSVGHNTLRLTPPLIVSYPEIQCCLDMISSVFTEIVEEKNNKKIDSHL